MASPSPPARSKPRFVGGAAAGALAVVVLAVLVTRGNEETSVATTPPPIPSTTVGATLPPTVPTTAPSTTAVATDVVLVGTVNPDDWCSELHGEGRTAIAAEPGQPTSACLITVNGLPFHTPINARDACRFTFGADAWSLQSADPIECAATRPIELTDSALDATPPNLVTECIAAGLVPPGANQQLTDAAETIKAVIDGLDPITAGCPRTDVHEWAPGYIQDLGQMGVGTGAVMLLPGHEPFALLGRAWTLFTAHDGARSVDLLGYPVSQTRHESLLVTELALGGALVYDESADAAWFIDDRFWPAVNDAGGVDACMPPVRVAQINGLATLLCTDNQFVLDVDGVVKEVGS